MEQRPLGGGVANRMTGPGELEVEGIGATTKNPHVCREGVRVRAVVRGRG